MTLFIQAHFLTSYPPSNLNRDDLGMPKTTYMGGANRLRISSQSLKRAWRTSDLFEEALGEHMGQRTKKIGRKIYQKFIENGITEKDATFWTKKIISVFGKNDSNADKIKKDKLSEFDINQLVHISNEEQRKIDLLISKCSAEQKAPNDEDLNLLCKEKTSVDIACFGRMLADDAQYNVDAAIQVAHAITTHSIDIEEDYFTAVDDLKEGSENTGSAHIGESSYGCGLFYHYVCINYDLLKNNLGGDEDLAKKTVSALMEVMAKVSPTGKQNSFASRSYTSYMIVEKGTKQPRSLSVAFLNPVKEKNLLLESIKALENMRDNFDKAYGACFACEKFNILEGEGTLDDLIKFSISE